MARRGFATRQPARVRAFTPTDRLRTGSQGDEPVYRITVDLPRQYITAYGRHENLKPGMLLDADIMGEKRRLIEWLVEPLYSVAGKVGNAE